MKVAYISSDGDYGACTFENEIGIDMLPEFWKKAKENNGEIYIDPKTKHIYKSYEEIPDALDIQEEYPISIKSFEFGWVDPNFIKFIKQNIQDYDDSKHRNFYIVKEQIMKGKKVLEAKLGGLTISVEFTDETAAFFFVDESIIAGCIDYNKLHEIIESLELSDIIDPNIENTYGFSGISWRNKNE